MPSPTLAAFLVCTLLSAQEPAWTAPVVAAIEALQQRDQVPGLSCVVGVGDAMPFRRGFGLADVENDLPATASTVYRLASISKPITAVRVVVAILCNLERCRMQPLAKQIADLVATPEAK